MAVYGSILRFPFALCGNWTVGRPIYIFVELTSPIPRAAVLESYMVRSLFRGWRLRVVHFTD